MNLGKSSITKSPKNCKKSDSGRVYDTHMILDNNLAFEKTQAFNQVYNKLRYDSITKFNKYNQYKQTFRKFNKCSANDHLITNIKSKYNPDLNYKQINEDLEKLAEPQEIEHNDKEIRGNNYPLLSVTSNNVQLLPVANNNQPIREGS